jgi:secreted trypsin-like serine protease
VLTAAHCASEAVAVVGARRLADPRCGGRRVPVCRAFRHAGFQRHRAFRHDLALVELASEVTTGSITLSPSDMVLDPGAVLKAFGWRLDSGLPSLELRRRRVRLLTSASAERRLSGWEGRTLAAEVLAAEPVAWPGDSGGPVVLDRDEGPLLVGIVGRSGLGELPDLITAISPYRQWIERVIAGDLSSAESCFLSPDPAASSGAG